MSFKKSFYKLKDGVSNKAPLILTCAGIVGFVTTVILACKETKDAEEIFESHNACMGNLKDAEADGIYNKKDLRKEKFSIYTTTSIFLVKNYIPAVLTGSASILCFLSSYKILNKRYLAASALAASLSEAFISYRERVKERFGDDVERQLYLGTSEVVETTMNGKKKETKVYDVMDPNNIPIYSKFFDESNPQWHKDPSLNYAFLKALQMEADRIFKARGKLLLSEVYNMLYIPVTIISSQVGWFESHGDKFVSFGLFDPENERKRAFVNGYEPSILLTFNCVPIWDGDLEYA